MSRITFIDSFVYFIGHEKRGPVKIGISGSPEVRLVDLQSANPIDLDVLIQFRGGEAEEEALHKLFAAERIRGEWFRRSARIKKFIDMINCNVALYMAMEQCDPKAIRAAQLRERETAKRAKAREREATKQAKARAELPAKLARWGFQIVRDASGNKTWVKDYRRTP